MLNTTLPRHLLSGAVHLCSIFPGKDNAFHYKNSLQAVLGPGAGEAGAGHLCPKTCLLSDLITLPGNSKDKSSKLLPMDSRRRGTSVEGTLSGPEARPPPCVEKLPFLRAELEVVSMFQMPMWAKSLAGCSTQDGLGRLTFPFPLPLQMAPGPNTTHGRKSKSHCLLGPPPSCWCFTVST